MAKGLKPVPTQETTVEMCKTESCKKKAARFTFCDEHYEWFKFGLITKAGKKVSDFDKKWAQYQAHVGQTAKKAA